MDPTDSVPKKERKEKEYMMPKFIKNTCTNKYGGWNSNCLSTTWMKSGCKGGWLDESSKDLWHPLCGQHVHHNKHDI